MQLKLTRSAILVLILGCVIALCPSAHAQGAKGILGFPFLHWGMTISDFGSAVKGKKGYDVDPSKCGGPSTDQWDENSFVCGMRFDGPPFKIAGYQVSGNLVSFIFKQANGTYVLTMYSATHTMKKFTDITGIKNHFGAHFKPLSNQRLETESMHFAWDAGDSEIHVGQDMSYLKAGGESANGLWFRVVSKP